MKIMDNTEILKERKRKADRIMQLYQVEKEKQTEIASELSIPECIVGNVTQAYGYEEEKDHTFIKTPVFYDELGCLDKYNF